MLTEAQRRRSRPTLPRFSPPTPYIHGQDGTRAERLAATRLRPYNQTLSRKRLQEVRASFTALMGSEATETFEAMDYFVRQADEVRRWEERRLSCSESASFLAANNSLEDIVVASLEGIQFYGQGRLHLERFRWRVKGFQGEMPQAADYCPEITKGDVRPAVYSKTGPPTTAKGACIISDSESLARRAGFSVSIPHWTAYAIVSSIILRRVAKNDDDVLKEVKQLVYGGQAIGIDGGGGRMISHQHTERNYPSRRVITANAAYLGDPDHGAPLLPNPFPSEVSHRLHAVFSPPRNMSVGLVQYLEQAEFVSSACWRSRPAFKFEQAMKGELLVQGVGGVWGMNSVSAFYTKRNEQGESESILRMRSLFAKEGLAVNRCDPTNLNTISSPTFHLDVVLETSGVMRFTVVQAELDRLKVSNADDLRMRIEKVDGTWTGVFVQVEEDGHGRASYSSIIPPPTVKPFFDLRRLRLYAECQIARLYRGEQFGMDVTDVGISTEEGKVIEMQASATEAAPRVSNYDFCTAVAAAAEEVPMTFKQPSLVKQKKRASPVMLNRARCKAVVPPISPFSFSIPGCLFPTDDILDLGNPIATRNAETGGWSVRFAKGGDFRVDITAENLDSNSATKVKDALDLLDETVEQVKLAGISL